MHFLKHVCATLTLFITLSVITPPAFAQSSDVQSSGAQDIFTVYGVKVDVTDTDAAAARNKALETARKQAFLLLSQRLLPDDIALEDIAVDENTISTLIKSFEINSEELSPVRYIASMTFYFRPQETQDFFNRMGQSNVVADAPAPILILPVMRYSDLQTGSVFWSAKNLWYSAWNSYDLRNSFVPLRLPLGDVMDRQIASEQAMIQHKKFVVDALMQRHQTTDALLVIFEMDDMSSRHALLHIYTPQKHKMEHTQTINISNPGDTQKDLFQASIKHIITFLEHRWKENAAAQKHLQQQTQHTGFRLPFMHEKQEPQPPTNQRVPITTDVVFHSMGQWLDIQKRMNGTFTVQSTEVMSLGRNAARVRIHYRGSPEQLRQSLQQEGLELAAPVSRRDHIYELRVSQNANHMNNNVPTQYHFETPPEEPEPQPVQPLNLSE